MPVFLRGFPDILKCCKSIHFIYFSIAIQLSSVVWAGNKTVLSEESSIEKKIGDLNNTFSSFGTKELGGNNTYFSEFESESAINDNNSFLMKNFIMVETIFPRSLSPNGRAYFKSVKEVLKKLVTDTVNAKTPYAMIKIFKEVSNVEYDFRTREMEFITDKEAFNIAYNLMTDFKLIKFLIKQAFLYRGMQIVQEFVEECETILSFPVKELVDEHGHALSSPVIIYPKKFPYQKIADLKKLLLVLKEDLKRVRDKWTVFHLTRIPPTFIRILVLLQNLKTMSPFVYLNGLYSRIEFRGFQITKMADWLIA